MPERPSSRVQTYIFAKSAGWTAESAKAWLDRYGYSTSLDETDDSFRARQHEPETFEEGSFRTITLPGTASKPIKAVIGRPK